MKKENNIRNEKRESKGKNTSGMQPEKTENRSKSIEEEAAAKVQADKKRRRNLILIRCVAAAVVAVLVIVALNIGGQKPAESAVDAENAAIGINTVEKAKASEKTKVASTDSRKTEVKKPEKEQSGNKEEQTDGQKTDENSKKNAGEKDNSTEDKKAKRKIVYKVPDERNERTEEEFSEEPSGDSKTVEPSEGAQDQEDAQEESVNQPPESATPEAPAEPQQPQEDDYAPSDPVVTPEPHSHTWQEKYRTVHHDAVTEDVKVVDQPAYTEPVYEEQPVYETISVYICDVCGEEFESVGEHSQTHIDWETFTNPFHYHVDFRQGGQIGTEMIQTGSITYPEESHMETRVVKEAYDEQIFDGYVCTGCGAVQ